MCNATASVLSQVDTRYFILMVWMPSVPKEGCGMNTIQTDEGIARKHLSAAGYRFQTRIIVNLDPATYHLKHPSKTPWFAVLRLCALDDSDNLYVAASELARTGRVLEVHSLPASKDMVTLRPHDTNLDLFTDDNSNTSTSAPGSGAGPFTRRRCSPS